MSDNQNAMNKALAKAQAAVMVAVKDGKNPHFNCRYATLGEVLDTVREPLSANGFALLQDADTDLEEMNVGVVTRLLHESGGEIASRRLSCQLRPEYAKDGKELKPSVQQVGALVTYLRRYSLCSFLSVAVEDDDGNEVSQIGKGGPPPAKAPAAGQAAAAPAAQGTRRSAHTGEKLDTPEAVARHKAAAEKRPAAEGGTDKAVPGVANRELAGAMFEAHLSKDGLEGYLRGEVGSPRISKPLLTGKLGLETLGAPIVAAMMRPDNWKLIAERVHADEAYTPF